MSALTSERLLPTREVADRTGVSRRTVEVWIRRGLIRATRLGENGRYRVPESEIARIIGAALLAADEEAAA